MGRVMRFNLVGFAHSLCYLNCPNWLTCAIGGKKYSLLQCFTFLSEPTFMHF